MEVSRNESTNSAIRIGPSNCFHRPYWLTDSVEIPKKLKNGGSPDVT